LFCCTKAAAVVSAISSAAASSLPFRPLPSSSSSLPSMASPSSPASSPYSDRYGVKNAESALNSLAAFACLLPLQQYIFSCSNPELAANRGLCCHSNWLLSQFCGPNVFPKRSEAREFCPSSGESHAGGGGDGEMTPGQPPDHELAVFFGTDRDCSQTPYAARSHLPSRSRGLGILGYNGWRGAVVDVSFPLSGPGRNR